MRDRSEEQGRAQLGAEEEAEDKDVDPHIAMHQRLAQLGYYQVLGDLGEQAITAFAEAGVDLTGLAEYVVDFQTDPEGAFRMELSRSVEVQVGAVVMSLAKVITGRLASGLCELAGVSAGGEKVDQIATDSTLKV